MQVTSIFTMCTQIECVQSEICTLNLVLYSRLLVLNMHPVLSLHLSTSYVHIRTQKKEEI
jgi:hypothetical protein